MAKLPFSKLGLKVKNDNVMLSYNDQEFEIHTYLPFEDKAELVSKIVNNSIDENNFCNPMRVELFTAIAVVEAYANLSFTAKQKEDPFKLYDLLYSSGLLQIIIDAIGNEWTLIQNYVAVVIKNIYDYRNSAMGIMEAITTDYSNLEMDAKTINASLSNPENLTLLRDILSKMG